jgi:hypothetical protein
VTYRSWFALGYALGGTISLALVAAGMKWWAAIPSAWGLVLGYGIGDYVRWRRGRRLS